MSRQRAPLLALAALWAAVSTAGAEESGGEIESDDRLNPVAQFWQEQRASGLWRTDYFRSSKKLDDATDFFGSTLQLKALPHLSSTLEGKLEVRVTNESVGKSAATRANWLEGYVTVHFSAADLRIGKQIVAWGRADGINPTDNLTPRDYTVLLPFEDDQRFGTPAVKLDAFVSEKHTLTVYVSPLFEPARIPLPAAAGSIRESKPAHSLSNTSVGVKLNKVGEGLDWSVSYFRGFSLWPDASVAESTGASALELHHPRISAFGADFARNYGRFGIRGEMAYIDTADDSGADPEVRSPHLHWIVGVDRTFFDNLNINLQFFQRRVRHYRDPQTFIDPLQRAAAVQNALVAGQRDRVSNGSSFRISNKWLNDTLEVEVFAVVNFTRGDCFLRPLVTYAFSDDWKATVGGEFYRGSPQTQFGSLEPNRGVFAELRYGF
jgi:hypothetical protein